MTYDFHHDSMTPRLAVVWIIEFEIWISKERAESTFSSSSNLRQFIAVSGERERGVIRVNDQVIQLHTAQRELKSKYLKNHVYGNTLNIQNFFFFLHHATPHKA